MTLVLKDPEAVLDYAIDWGAEYLSAGELLADSSWSVVPSGAGALAIVGSDHDHQRTTVKAGGGTAGGIYRLVNSIVTGAGRTDERSFVVRVENR